MLAALWLAPVGAQSHWAYSQGEHFEVYTTGGDEVARRALEQFDRVHVYFEQALHLQPITGPRTHLIVFNTPEEFAPYASNASVKAFYQSSVDGDFIVLPTLRGDVFPAIAHEYAHLVSRRSGNHYPLWLDDGLAEYLSTVTPQNAKLQIGAPPPERTRALGFGVRLMPLERLFAIGRDSAEYNTPARAGLFYAQSWALTHMLLTDERYRDRSAALLAKLGHNEPTALALTTVYGRPVDDIARDLSKYTLRGHYKTSLIDVNLPDTATASTPRPATDFEAGVMMATLLAANQARRADAARAFSALELQNPNDLFLIESEAMFAVRAMRYDDARPLLERAILLQSANARIYSHLADIRSTAADNAHYTAEDQDALLATALSLAPADVEVRIQVARALVRQRRGTDALVMLDSIGRVPIEYQLLFADTRAAALKLGGTDR